LENENELKIKSKNQHYDFDLRPEWPELRSIFFYIMM